MTGEATERLYVDASAFVKLLVPEPESTALDRLLGPRSRLVSSDLLEIEVMRVARRLDPGLRARAAGALRSVQLVPIRDIVRRRAASIGPPALRSLDAIHLATADLLRDDLDALVAYDDRLAEAAAALGIRVLSPR
ncbi:MAG: PIN domain-containing protein [Solirubrobacterales bacterium]|nr:PIN domain-containing protein [Solirubrobacterales bacterium]